MFFVKNTAFKAKNEFLYAQGTLCFHEKKVIQKHRFHTVNEKLNINGKKIKIKAFFTAKNGCERG